MEYVNDNRVLDLVSESLARQTLCGLLEIQTERARLQLRREKREASELSRILMTSFVVGVLASVAFWMQ